MQNSSHSWTYSSRSTREIYHEAWGWCVERKKKRRQHLESLSGFFDSIFCRFSSSSIVSQLLQFVTHSACSYPLVEGLSGKKRRQSVDRMLTLQLIICFISRKIRKQIVRYLWHRSSPSSCNENIFLAGAVGILHINQESLQLPWAQKALSFPWLGKKFERIDTK